MSRRKTATYVCNVGGVPIPPWRAPLTVCRMLLGMLRRPGVKIILEPVCCRCDACGQILTTDLHEVYGHVHWTHGRKSFVIEDLTSDSGDDDDDNDAKTEAG